MALLGDSALAMWWDMAPDMRAEFEHWHSHEHFPERLALPGFLRASRWAAADGGEGFFILYELQDHAALSSPEYLASLNAPTPWSTKLMPHHRNMVRSQCRVLESRGGGIARHALTVRLSPAEGADDRLRAFFHDLVEQLAARPGLTGAHLLKHQAPRMATTTEQKIRNEADQVADWVLVVCGYSREPIAALPERELSESPLILRGAVGPQISELYTLAYSVTPADCVPPRR
jgi:hypothetical protein